MTVTQSYHSQVTQIGALHAEQIAEAALLYVFDIKFPASLLYCLKPEKDNIEINSSSFALLTMCISYGEIYPQPSENL